MNRYLKLLFKLLFIICLPALECKLHEYSYFKKTLLLFESSLCSQENKRKEQKFPMYYLLRQGFLKFIFVALAYGKWQAVNEFLLLKQ